MENIEIFNENIEVEQKNNKIIKNKFTKKDEYTNIIKNKWLNQKNLDLDIDIEKKTNKNDKYDNKNIYLNVSLNYWLIHDNNKYYNEKFNGNNDINSYNEKISKANKKFNSKILYYLIKIKNIVLVGKKYI